MAEWPCRVVYSTAGHAVEDAVSRLTERRIGECTVLEIGHVYNYAEFPRAFEEWFAFLHAADPVGIDRKTVSRVLEGFNQSE